MKLALAATMAAFLVVAPILLAAKPPTPNPDLWADVNVDGTLAHGNHAVSSAQLGADGTYEVVFDRDVSACAYAGSGVADDGLTIGVAPRDTNPDAVYVVEYDTILARDSYSSGFDLIVTC